MPQILEGLWEELVRHAELLKGKRVRIVVLEPPEADEPPSGASAHPLTQIIGIAEGGEPDLSTHHDQHLQP
jgi:hypothetical protein